MQSTPWKIRVVCGLTLLGLTGCQTYSPYGMGGSPGGIYSEFYQPLTADRLFFVVPHIEWKQRSVDLYDDNNRIAPDKR